MPITIFNVSGVISRFLKRTTTNDDKTALRSDLAAAALASPTFTGAPTAPTPDPGDSSTKLATTAFVATYGTAKAPLASPTFTGVPAAPTAAPGTATTQLATTAFVANETGAGLSYDPAITGLTGGGATNLDGIVTVDVPVGRIQNVYVSSFLYQYILTAGTVGESSPSYIRPDDYNASTNAKYWHFLRCKLLAPYFYGAFESFQTSVIGFGLSPENLTDYRTHYAPDADGFYALETTVTELIPLTGDVITTGRYVDETTVLVPAGTLATLTLNLPTTPDNRLGQIKTFFSTQNVTAVSVVSAGTIYGSALTALAANTSYSFQCINTSEDAWIRLF